MIVCAVHKKGLATACGAQEGREFSRTSESRPPVCAASKQGLPCVPHQKARLEKTSNRWASLVLHKQPQHLPCVPQAITRPQLRATINHIPCEPQAITRPPLFATSNHKVRLVYHKQSKASLVCHKQSQNPPCVRPPLCTASKASRPSCAPQAIARPLLCTANNQASLACHKQWQGLLVYHKQSQGLLCVPQAITRPPLCTGLVGISQTVAGRGMCAASMCHKQSLACFTSNRHTSLAYRNQSQGLNCMPQATTRLYKRSQAQASLVRKQ